MTYRPLAEANPVPYSDSLPSTAWSATALLDVIDERNTHMDVKELATPPEPDTRPGWPVALLASAAVAAVVVGAVFVARSGESTAPEPADQPSVTTTLDPAPDEPVFAESTTTVTTDSAALSAAEQDYVESFVAAFNERRTDDLLSFLAVDASVMDSVIWEGDRDLFAQSLPWREAMNERWELVECKRLSKLSCTIILHSDAIDFQFGPRRAGLGLVVTNGIITDLQLQANMDVVSATLEPFYAWVREQDGPGPAIAGGGTPGQPITTPEATERWIEYLAAYKAEMGFDG